MNEQLKDFLDNGYTPFQTTELAVRFLTENGFRRAVRGALPALKKGDRYFVSENGALVAFTVAAPRSMQLALSHTDSPMLKIKGEKTLDGDIRRLNCEAYGGGIHYSYFDIPLKICGRVYTQNGDCIEGKNVVSPYCITIPSQPIHHNRDVNEGFKASRQIDMAPLLGEDAAGFIADLAGCSDVLDFDLYACPALKPYESGWKNEFLCAPRIDNLTSVFASLHALVTAEPQGINLCACLNNEEIGSGTPQGADSVFLPRLVKEIYAKAGGENYADCLDNSFILSVDNAHALHPAHPEKSDPANRVRMNGGVVIKRHSHYATDALSAAAAKRIFSAASVPVQDYYNHSDLTCGSTLGLFSSCNLGMRACDIGIAQLAMHSAVETCGARDPLHMQTALTKFFSARVRFTQEGARVTV